MSMKNHRPWEKHYDYWVRTNLSYPGRSLYDILALTALERPDKQATQFLGAELTYRDLKRRADRSTLRVQGGPGEADVCVSPPKIQLSKGLQPKFCRNRLGKGEARATQQVFGDPNPEAPPV